jgi:hypothetical protein
MNFMNISSTSTICVWSFQCCIFFVAKQRHWISALHANADQTSWHRDWHKSGTEKWTLNIELYKLGKKIFILFPNNYFSCAGICSKIKRKENILTPRSVHLCTFELKYVMLLRVCWQCERYNACKAGWRLQCLAINTDNVLKISRLQLYDFLTYSVLPSISLILFLPFALT